MGRSGKRVLLRADRARGRRLISALVPLFLILCSLQLVATPQARAAAAPTVASLSPSSGKLAGGTKVTVTGTDLTGATGVTFGGTAGTALTVVSATQLTVSTPAGTSPGAVDVVVTTPGGSATATGAYTYLPLPTVTSISPSAGPLGGGTVVTVTGTDLGSTSKVTFGGVAGTALTVVSPTQLQVTSPARGTAGLVDVRVTTPEGMSAVAAADKFSYRAAPTVVSVSPSSGAVGGGTKVTVTGTALTGATEVTFGGTPGKNLRVVSATQLTVSAPAGASAGPVDVAVTTPGGTATATGAYTYLPLPAVTSISPSAGPLAGGTVVTITGSNLDQASKVTFGGVVGTALTLLSPTKLQVTSPARSAGSVDVRVTTPNGVSAVAVGDRFAYQDVPAISAVSPVGGPVAGDTVVTITGANLSGASTVTFGGVAGTGVQVVSSGQLTVTAPAGTAPGPVDVAVTTPGGSATAPAAYSYTGDLPAPASQCGTISANETLLTGQTYVFTCGVDITSGVTITLQPGAVLKVAQGAEIEVEGSLLAGAGAVITSLRDDSVGGDTDGGGDTDLPAAGDWAGVYVTTGGTLSLAGATVNYGGAISTSDAAQLSVTDSQLANGVWLSIYRSYNGTGPITVTGTTVSAVGPAPAGISVDVRNDRDGIAPTVMNDVVTGVTRTGSGDSSSGWPIAVKGYRLLPAQLSGNTGSGNAQDGFYVSGSIAGDLTLPAAGLPWVVAQSWAQLDVLPGVTLQLNDGAVLKVAQGSNIEVEGALVAGAGTTITSIRDDSVGGNTDGGGDTDLPAAGDWSGISVNTGATLDLAGSTVRYGGAISASDAAAVSVVNSHLTDGVSLSIYRSYNSTGAITVTGTTVSAVGPVSSGISVQSMNDRDGIAPTIANNTVSGVVPAGGAASSGRAITVAGYRLLAARLAGNKGSLNTQNALFVSGTLADSVTFPAPGLRWVVDSGYPFGGLTVLPPATLTLNTGAVLKIAPGGTIDVDGSLVAAGATITSLRDDTVGGDTNGDGKFTHPAAGDHSGISVDSGGTLNLSGATVRYGGAITVSDAASVSVVDSQLQNGVSLSIYRGYNSTGPVTVTGTTVSAVGPAASGILVQSMNDQDGIAPTVANNTVNGVLRTSAGDPNSGRPITITGYQLLPAQLAGNSGSGNAQNAMFVSGSLSGDVTFPAPGFRWVVDGSWPYWGLTINPSVTLTLNPGALLKVGLGAAISVNGSLVVTGSSTAAATITSIRDDVGGDTNGDGTDTTPSAHDLSGISVGSGATLSLSQATIRYGAAINASDAASVAVVNSQLRNGVSLSVYRSYSATGPVTVTGTTVAAVGAAQNGILVQSMNDQDGIAPTVANNTVSGVLRTSPGDPNSGRPITITGYQLLPGQLAGNSGSGNAQNAMFVSGSLNGDATFPAPGFRWVADGSWPYWGLTINPSATLTLNAGAVLKVGAGGSIDVSGSLVVSGSSTSMATITSLADDSVAGDTNGDGANSKPAAGDVGGIYVSSGATLALSRASVRYGGVISTSDAASVSVVNSQLRNGVSLSVYRSSSGTGPITVTGTTVSTVGAATSGISVQTMNDQDGIAPTVTGNTVSGVRRTSAGDSTSGRPVTVMGYRLLPAQLTGNAGSSNTQNALFLSGTLAGDATAPAQGLPWLIDNSWYFGGLTVLQGATVTVNAGTVLKAEPGAGVYVNGTLAANGTPDQPVTFTSVYDDAAGGDTNADGLATVPTPGDWPGITAGSGGTVTLDGTGIHYASTALTVAGDAAAAELHGSVVHSSVGVSGDVYVDASNVDWGDPSGPAPYGSGVPITGNGVLVTPWVGYVEPPRPTDTPAYVPPTSYSCARIAFIGARGSGEAPTGDYQVYDTDPMSGNGGLGDKLPGLISGMRGTLAHYGWSDSEVKVLPVHYRAREADNPLNYATGWYFDSIYDGVDQVSSMILDEELHCPSEKIVLGGYSQGALAIHIALRDLQRSDPGALSADHIAAVLMVADPGKVAYGAEDTWENDEELAGTGVTKADGIWTRTVLGDDKGPLPSAITGRTLAICHNHDIVCSPGIGSTVGNHTSYDWSEEYDMGIWAADIYLGVQPPAVL